MFNLRFLEDNLLSLDLTFRTTIVRMIYPLTLRSQAKLQQYNKIDKILLRKNRTKFGCVKKYSQVEI